MALNGLHLVQNEMVTKKPSQNLFRQNIISKSGRLLFLLIATNGNFRVDARFSKS